MKAFYNAIISMFITISFISCQDRYHKKEYVSTDIKKYISTGGVEEGKLQCPTSVNDLIVELESLHSLPKKGEPQMTIAGIHTFIKEEQITTITQLLNKLPKHYRTNFSLVEKTKGEGQSNLKYPRIVLFGSDGRFLANISTKPDDPKHDLLDVAELDIETGLWEFSQFDFTDKKPKLHTNPTSCIRCHGKKPRPVWGSNMDWPGVFGDNEAAGPNGEALSYRHAIRMNEIKEGQGDSDRFDFLNWSDQKLTSGGVRLIADHSFGAELLISNMAMGTSTALGVFTRMKNETPTLYKELREVLLIAGYEYMVPGILSDKDKYTLQVILNKYDNLGNDINSVFEVLGVDTKEAFSLGTLAAEEVPKTDWSLGAGNLYDLILLQVLDDVMKNDIEVADILSSTPNSPGIFGCKSLGKNIKEVVDFKMLHMFYLSGSARYEVNKVYYPQDVENIKEKVFVPIYDQLMPYLKEKAFVQDL